MARKNLKFQNLANIQDLATRQELDYFRRQVEDAISTSAEDNPSSVTKVLQQAITTNSITVTGGGTTDHAALIHLDYASSGHTGFASQAQLDDDITLFWLTGFRV